MVISLSVFKGSTIFIQVMLLPLQALGFADSHHPGNHGGQATPPIAPGRSRAFKTCLVLVRLSPKKRHTGPNCTSNTSPSNICWAHASLQTDSQSLPTTIMSYSSMCFRFLDAICTFPFLQLTNHQEGTAAAKPKPPGHTPLPTAQRDPSN